MIFAKYSVFYANFLIINLVTENITRQMYSYEFTSHIGEWI